MPAETRGDEQERSLPIGESPLEQRPVSTRSTDLTGCSRASTGRSTSRGAAVKAYRTPGQRTGGLRSSRVNGFADLSRAAGRSRGKMRSGCVVIAFIGRLSLSTIKGASAPLIEEQIYEGDGIRGRRTTRRITSFGLLLLSLLGSMTVAPRAAQTSTPVWSGTGPMASARSLHTATLLPTGEVLVTGGTDEAGNALASSELYSPTGKWSATGSMTVARASHTATLLAKGQVLVAGGTGGGGALLDSAELYDPGTGTWAATG